MYADQLNPSEYKSTKISISFLKANIVSLIYPIPIILIYLFLVYWFSLRRSTDMILSFQFDHLSDIGFFLLFYMGGILILIFLHELLHALFFLRGCENGWKSIRFGVKSLTPYCHCKEVTTVSVFRQALFAPLWALCLPLAAVALATNIGMLHLLTIVIIAGSGGDLWVAMKLRRYNGKTCYAQDLEDEIGLIVYEPISEPLHSPTISASDGEDL